MKLALFDLDHTLLPVDSDHTWGQFCVQMGWVDAAEHTRRNDAFYGQYSNGTLNINEYIAFSTQAFVNAGPGVASAARERFMHECIAPHLLPEALALIAEHRAAGHQVVIVTATNEFVTRPIAQALGVSELIAVNLARDAIGWFTPHVEGTPSFQGGKVTRVHEWLAAQDLRWSDVEESWFYSDSPNDLPLLELVTHPVATNPSAELRRTASQRGWRILDLFQSTL